MYRLGWPWVAPPARFASATKYTYEPGQDHRLPYDPNAGLATQVAQSMGSSLEHLGTDHVDSYVLHGPASGHAWSDDDAEVWGAMARERDAGRTRLLGVSNVSLRQLQQMAATGAEMPAFVQNRCFAVRGWDRDVRAFCTQRRIAYQGFSLLTANPDVLRHPLVTGIAGRSQATTAQVVFAFAGAVGMFQVMQHPSEGPITYVRPPTKFADTPANVRHQAPVLGQDTAAILAELGYDAAEIAALAEKKVIVRGK